MVPTMTNLRLLALTLMGLTALPACADQEGDTSLPAGVDPGALVAVDMVSRVGVLLDEMPADTRDRVTADLLAKPDSFWIARARRQIKLATYRLVFREYYYSTLKKQLPLPNDAVWNVTLTGTPHRVIDNRHDTVVVDYKLETTILTDAASPGVSEPKLAKVGGTWNEPFTFPIDPEMILQRTGYACIDEAEFPRGSVDSEEVDTFYDQDCTVESEPTLAGCHQTVMAAESCKSALRNHIGKVDTAMHFTRLAWNQALADQVRVGDTTAAEGADMQVWLPDFTQNRTEYKYFAPDSCELAEACIGAPGWRRVLQFNSSDENTGSSTLEIGAIDYYLTGEQTLNDLYHIFEFHSCHQHYHFTHYGSFQYDAPGASTTHKQGFCLQSTDRVANTENSPLHNIYAGCEYQGVEVGWVDQYKMGLPCQWVDVTDVDTSAGPVTAPLTFTSNPDGFLCEGSPVIDEQGNPVFEPTAFTTVDGDTVWRPKCDFADGWDTNNSDSYDATVPAPGESFIGRTCDRGQIGPMRNCGFTAKQQLETCTAGAPATLHCDIPADAAPQLVRVCESSAVLGVGTACKYENALATVTVGAGGADVPFACPAPRDADEPGGLYSLYTAPVYPGDKKAKVSCELR